MNPEMRSWGKESMDILTMFMIVAIAALKEKKKIEIGEFFFKCTPCI